MSHQNLINTFDTLLPRTQKGEKIAILGGSFNPPHLCHQLLVLSVLALEPVDSVWVIPCANHPFHKTLIAFHHRLAMCRLAFSRFCKQVHVLDIENHLPSPNYTVQTLEAIHALRPDTDLYLTLGSDAYAQLAKWHQPERLKHLCRMIVFLREGFPTSFETTKEPFIRIHRGYVLPNVASSHIRKAITNTQDNNPEFTSIDHQVAAYIEKEGLYAR